MIAEEIATWPDRLEAATAGTRFRTELVRVVSQCDSTQDLARTLGRGAIVTTGRQVGGRGRLGRAWLDDEGAGIAVSLAVDVADPETLALAAGLAARAAIAEACPVVESRLGVKHPNDVVDRTTARKIGGVLVESDGVTAVIGIGINVHARSWPPDVPATAVADLFPDDHVGPGPTRVGILERLIPAIDRLLSTPVGELGRSFADVHAPTGRQVRLETPSGEFHGRLVAYDPRSHLEIENEQGRHRCGATTTRILAWSAVEDPTV